MIGTNVNPWDVAYSDPRASIGNYSAGSSTWDMAVLRKVGSVVTQMELNSDAFSTPIDTLIDIWLARFGNGWVDSASIENDEFFRLAMQRLRQLGHIEVHYLTDRMTFVCRKPA